MKKTLAILSLALLSAVGAMAQSTKKVMTVIQKDGTKVVYAVSNVERVTFTDREQPALDNQWALNDDVKAIGSVVVTELTEQYQIDLYENTELSGDPDLGGGDTPDITVVLPKTLMGKTVDLSSEDGQQIVFTKGSDTVKPTGTFQAKFDKFVKNITIALDGELNGSDEFRAAYKGAVKKAYTASGEITVTPKDGETSTWTIYTPFVVNPSSLGQPTQFAFADEAGAEPADVKTGNYALWVSVSASKLYTSDVDMSTETDSYTFHFIDYATGTTYTTVTSGTITTAQDYLGRSYVKVSATLENGTVVSAEYVGNYIETTDLEPIIPTPVMKNGYHFYNSDGDETNSVTVDKVLYKDKTTYKVFYFYPKGSTSKYDDAKVEIQFNVDMVNAGKIDLSALKDGDMFYVKYNQGGISLSSPDSKYMGYGNTPNNGQFTISCDENGKYEIYLDVKNKYSCTGTGVTDGGDNTRLVLSYKGELSGTY